MKRDNSRPLPGEGASAAPAAAAAQEIIAHPGAERSYVAALLQKNELIEFAMEDDLGMITDNGYRHIVGSILQLYEEGWKDIDKYTIVNLADRHERVKQVLMDMGGIEHLERICSFQMSIQNFPKTRQLLKDLYAKRLILDGFERTLRNAKAMAENDKVTPDELLKQAELSAGEIAQKIHSKSDFIRVTYNPDEFIEKARRELSEGITFKGIPTNMPGYDEGYGGFGKGRLHVFGAPTGCGKSLLCINWARSAAYGMVSGDPQHRVAIIDTGELMYEEDFLPRFISCDSGVRVKAIQKNWFSNNPAETEAVKATLKRFEQNPVLWYQMPDFDGPSVKALVKRLVKREGVEIVFFDNIKINPSWSQNGKGDVYNKVGDLAQALKEAAVECGIPVVAFIQLTADGSVVGRKKLAMSRPHVSMFAGGQRTLHNVDVGGVLDWEVHDDHLNDNRILIIQKARNDRIHRKDEHMICIGDLRRSRLTVERNKTVDSLDSDGNPNPFVANDVIPAASESHDEEAEAVYNDALSSEPSAQSLDASAEGAPRKSLKAFRPGV